MDTQRTLADYRPQHDSKCAIVTCEACGHPEAIHRNGYVMGYGACPAGVKAPGACTCGLNALLASSTVRC